MLRLILRSAFFILLCVSTIVESYGKTGKVKPYIQVEFEIESDIISQYNTSVYGNPFSGNYRSILNIAPELAGLTGIRLPVDAWGNMKAASVVFSFDRSVQLLIGVTPRQGEKSTDASQLEQLSFGNGVLSSKVILKNAVSITELPAMDIYAVSYKKGKQVIDIPEGLDFCVMVAGAVPDNQKMISRDVELADEPDYSAFYIDGFTAEKALFTVVGGSDNPVVNEGMPGTELIQGGFEAGSAVKIDDMYHMFPTERVGEPGGHIYHDRVKTRIGHWTSPDAVNWTRQSTILESSGVYALVPEDNPMNDRRSAIWSFNVVFNEGKNRWYGYYLAYTTDKSITPNHSFGRIWRCESEVEGLEGIGGPYKDMGIIIEPGLDSQLWEGRQGVASFYPFQVGDKWYGLISGAFPFESKEDYPLHGGAKKQAWYVGLAQSETMEGPWTRMGEDINPLTSIHPNFVENPIVSRLPNGLYIAMFDGGPESLKLPNKIAYTLSRDGLNWSRARYLAIDSDVNKWWMTMRTPLCLIPEGDNIYTIVYTAWVKDPKSYRANAKTRFNPIGMVQVKLDPEALEEVTSDLFPVIPAVNEVGAKVMPEEIEPIKNAPFGMPQLQRPVFPKRTISITERGAKPEKPITEIVNQAIADISNLGGGTVIIPPGKWKSGRVELKSNVNLHIVEGAALKFSDEPKDYLPAVFTRHEGVEIYGAGAFIYANGAENIALTGKGKIYGPDLKAAIREQSNSLFDIEGELSKTALGKRVFDGQEGRRFFSPKSISPINCKNVFIEGVTLERSLFWNVNPIYCENVIIRGVTVNSVGIPSGDGMNLSSCKNVLVEYCTLNCGDDCFTLKSGRGEDGWQVNKPTENVVIRHSLALRGHGGITCGSETAGNIKNVYVHDCVFDGTRTGIRFKTRRTRGGGTEGVYYERLRMMNVGEAFTWDLLGTEQFMGDLARRIPEHEVNELTPMIKDIRIKDFVVESASRFFTLNGIPEVPLANVHIKNGEINSRQLINAMHDVDGFIVENVIIQSQNNKINILDGRNILFDNVKFVVPQNNIILQVEGNKSDNIRFGNLRNDTSVITDKK